MKQQINERTYKQRNFKRNNKKREKIKPIRLVLINSDEDPFFYIIDKMYEKVPQFNQFVGYNDFESIEKFDDLVRICATNMMDSIPQLCDKKNIHSSFSMSSNRVYVRREDNVSFSVEVKYIIVEGKAKIVSCTGTVTLFEKKDDLMNALVEDGWTVEEK